MRAVLIEHRKLVLDDGAIIEIKVWQLPKPTPERPHGLKYSCFYGRRGQRIVGYDNEAGKGDHKHRRGVESAYRFKDFETLMRDFWRDVRKERTDE